MRISVLLSTYNGERYLGEQLRSLWQQTCQDFELVVRDDGSSDRTQEMLAQAQAEHSGRIRIVADDGLRLGPRDSFARLMRAARTPYIAFCDQDDYWLPDKLDALVSAVQRVEARRGGGCAVLACSDATVTDDALRATDASYFAKHGFSVADGRDLTLPRLIFRNYAIGAATVINQALAQRCAQVPQAAIMHDWWCALVATLLGEVAIVAKPLILYRQHGGNTIGSKRRSLPRNRAEALAALTWSRDSVARCVRQAQALRDEFASNVGGEAGKVLEAYADFHGQSPLQRAMTIVRTQAFKPGLTLNGMHLYACMTAHL